jgi:tol-pal system protein YbgF
VSGVRIAQWLLAAALAAALLGTAGAQQAPDRRTPRPAPPAGAPAPSPTNQALLDLLSEVESLQALVRQMRGQLEVQEHQLEQMKNRQHQSLVDFDRRLRELERRGASAAPGPSGSDGAPAVVVTPPISGSAVPPAATAAPRPAPTASEQQQYDAAFALMKQGLYEQAAKSFREFLVRNPRGALADNAQYWIGEAAYVTRDFRTALQEFGKVLNDYPQSPKVPDALLKIGYTHYELAAYEQAREALSQVRARYPNTMVAKSAELRLEKMTQEGR